MNLTEAFEHQAISCGRLGSPFMAQLLQILADCWPFESRVGKYFADFTGDVGPSGASLPLRIAGGLHALVLTGRSPGLQAVYPPQSVFDNILKSEVLEALDTHEAFLLDWVKSAPQTNEVRRCAALMPAAAVLCARIDLPVWLSELGASGGLNLMWDHFAMDLPGARMGATAPVLTLAPTWAGPLPPLDLPLIADRAGVDLNPLNPTHPDDLLRLTAYLWPDQPDRLERTRAAAAIMTAPVARGDAIDWLESRLEAAPDGHVHLIQHTVAWQYFPADAQARGRRLIEAAGVRATTHKPLAWLALESDGDTKAAHGAVLSLRLWPGDHAFDLGRVDFHGRWVRWTGAD
ncbi:MAG: DUF2332 domain-containing protein [Roseobacter sp.]